MFGELTPPHIPAEKVGYHCSLFELTYHGFFSHGPSLGASCTTGQYMPCSATEKNIHGLCLYSFLDGWQMSIEITLQAQDGAAFVWEARSLDWNLDNFPAPVTALLDRKRSIPSQLTSKHQASSELHASFLVPSYPKQGWLCGPSQPGVFSFSPPCSLFFILLKLPAFSKIKMGWKAGSCSPHEMLKLVSPKLFL